MPIDPQPPRLAKRGRIVNRLLAIMLVVGAVPVVVSGWNLIAYNTNILARDQQILHLQICKSLASEVGLFLQACTNTLTPLVKSLEQAFNPSHPKEVFDREASRVLLEGLFEAHNRIINIRAVYQDGQGVEAGYRIPEDSELGEALRQAYYRCLQGEYTYVSPPMYVDAFQQVALVIGRTVLIQNTIQGVVTVVFSMADVHASLERVRSSGNEAILLDSRGDLLLHADPLRLRDRPSLAGTTVFQEMKKLRFRAISTFPYEDFQDTRPVRMVGTVYMIPDAMVDWGVVVQTPEEVASLDIQKMQLQTVYWILFSIVLALLMSYLFAQRISTPIQSLAGKTLSISAGNFNERVDVRSRDEIGILADHFNQMAETIENYISRLRDAANQNRQLFLGAIRTLAAAIDAKDPYTRGHSERVTAYAILIARELGLGMADLERLTIAGLLHDVGKIGISDRILQKPNVLTEEEYTIMKQHPRLGADIMNQIAELGEVIPGMRHHHENVDGTGYPDGLTGEDIPLDARIIGVADSFDAMTTERPYQKPLEIDAALDRISNQVGTKFDGRVVAALQRAYRSGHLSRPDPGTLTQHKYIKSL